MITDLKDDPKAFRAAIREWLHRCAPKDWKNRVGDDEDAFVELQREWMIECAKVGLAIPHWPSAYGGADLSLTGQVILTDEMARADTPYFHHYMVALNHIPGTLIPFGTDAQKRKYLPEVPKGTIWCQGFSEPGAGSDLASLRCRAQHS